MTLQEALNTGRPFRHSASEVWEIPNPPRHISFNGYSLEQIMSMDWQVKPKAEKQTFTRREVDCMLISAGLRYNERHKLLGSFDV